MLSWLSKNIVYPLWDLKDGSKKLACLKDLEKSQWQSVNYLQETQWTKLQAIIAYAYENCPYYKDLFQEKRLSPGDIQHPNDLAKIPILTKKNIHLNLDRLITRHSTKADLVATKTGGSTGVPLKLFFDKTCQEIRNAAAMRSDKWAQWDLGVMKAALWGNPPIADTMKKKLRNLLLDRIIYLDTISLDEASMGSFAQEVKREKSFVLFGHAHSIFIFAKFFKKNCLTPLTPQGIISTSMMLLPHERQTIEQVFCCPVFDRYGCEEVGLIASECEKHEGMHMNIDHLYIEFLKEDGTPALPGEPGKIIVTDLMNHGMPLIRYRIEDVGIPSEHLCSCGRGLPLMQKVAGRVADFLVKKDGSQVSGISLIERTLTATTGIEQMQIVLNSVDEVILNIVCSADYSHENEKLLTKEFRRVFEDGTNIKFNYVQEIPQERSGKYRFSICNVVQ